MIFSLKIKNLSIFLFFCRKLIWANGKIIYYSTSPKGIVSAATTYCLTSVQLLQKKKNPPDIFSHFCPIFFWQPDDVKFSLWIFTLWFRVLEQYTVIFLPEWSILSFLHFPAIGQLSNRKELATVFNFRKDFFSVSNFILGQLVVVVINLRWKI